MRRTGYLNTWKSARNFIRLSVTGESESALNRNEKTSHKQ
jgi:hypothetical protein